MNEGRRIGATLALAAGAQVLATPALADCPAGATNGGTIGTGQVVNVSAGMNVCPTTINGDGRQDVYNGGSATSTTINDNGWQDTKNPPTEPKTMPISGHMIRETHMGKP